MIHELESVVEFLSSEGYAVEKEGMVSFEIKDRSYTPESLGWHTAGIYGILKSGEKVGEINEKSFVLTRYYDANRARRERGQPEREYRLKGTVIVYTAGGRRNLDLKSKLESQNIMVCGTLPTEDDMKDGRPVFVEPEFQMLSSLVK